MTLINNKHTHTQKKKENNLKKNIDNLRHLNEVYVNYQVKHKKDAKRADTVYSLFFVS